MADAAGAAAMPHFRTSSLQSDNKLLGAGFDPVTIADKNAEAAMRAILSSNRPEDGVFGEEQERTFGTSGLTWILDPIDGTRAFISGLPLWGTLIALDDSERGRIGIIDQPHIGERFVGVNTAAEVSAVLHHAERVTPLTTRSTGKLSDCTLFTTDPYLFRGAEQDVFQALRETVRLTRYGTDCYAYALVAMGTIDLVVETGLQAYDIAAHIPLIEAAGGIVTNWSGGDCRWGGQVIAAGSQAIHEQALALLAPASSNG